MKFENKNLGCQDFEGFMTQDNAKLDRLKIAVIGAGQGGGKIAAEFARLGFYSSLYNTSKEDNDNVRGILEKLEGVDYKILQLKGYDGASKDRAVGKKAITDNAELLKTELMNDKNIIDADFVWIIAALGGGTGNGSLATTAQVVSGMMRKNKRYLGKPTVGIIAAVPEAHSKHKIKLNAAQALKEIEVLQEKGLIASVLLLDNEKLINDYLDHGDETKDWTTYGNTTTARLLAELNGLLSIPGRETLDPSEFMDIICTPGFLTIGKMHLKEKRDDFEKLIEESFTNHNLFTDGYDYSTAVHGGMAILRPTHSNIFGVKDTLHLKRALSQFLDNSMVEVTHFGVYDVDTFGTYRNPRKLDEALIYTLAVTKKQPQHIIKMAEEALKRAEEQKEKMSVKHDELMSMLDNYEEVAPTKETEESDLTLDAIFAGDLFKTDPVNKQKEESSEEDVLINDDIFKQL